MKKESVKSQTQSKEKLFSFLVLIFKQKNLFLILYHYELKTFLFIINIKI